MRTKTSISIQNSNCVGYTNMNQSSIVSVLDKQAWDCQKQSLCRLHKHKPVIAFHVYYMTETFNTLFLLCYIPLCILCLIWNLYLNIILIYNYGIYLVPSSWQFNQTSIFNLHFSPHHMYGTQTYKLTYIDTQDATENPFKGKKPCGGVPTFCSDMSILVSEVLK